MLSISGSALTEFNRRKDGSSFRDWAFESFTEALAMSELGPKDIDLLVVASESDFLTLQLNPAAVLASDLGLVGASAMRVEGGGASGQLAVHAGAQAIFSGNASHVAVVGVDPCASQLPGSAVKELYGLSFDALIDGMSGISPTALYALSIQAFMDETGIDEGHLAEVTIRNRANAIKNPKAHLGLKHTIEEINESEPIALPYRRLHCSPLSDGAATVILSDSKKLPASRKQAPVISGMGSSSDHPHLAMRDNPGFFQAKQQAMQKACAMAGTKPADIGLAEVYDAYAGAQLQALHALGLSDDIATDLEQGIFDPTGRLPVNLSGGLMGQGAPAGAIGVGQTANCALFLEGRHHSALQPQEPPVLALADTHGGICSMAAVTIIAQHNWHNTP